MQPFLEATTSAYRQERFGSVPDTGIQGTSLATISGFCIYDDYGCCPVQKARCLKFQTGKTSDFEYLLSASAWMPGCTTRGSDADALEPGSCMLGLRRLLVDCHPDCAVQRVSLGLVGFHSEKSVLATAAKQSRKQPFLSNQLAT